MDAAQATLDRLMKIRSQKDISIKPTPLLRTTVRMLDGKEKPLTLRYYQVQMVLHLLSMRRFIVGDDTGLGKTLESISGLCYLWAREPDAKVLVLTKKSAVRQWVDEFKRFTTGVNVVVCKGTPKQRAEARAVFDASAGPTVIIMGHRSAVQDFSQIQDREWGVFVLDEATIAKNPSAQIHQVCRHISSKSRRAWGLTATLIKNNLIEGYGIYRCIEPALFPQTLNAFIDDYCVTQLINVGRGRKVKQVVGYRKASIAIFRQKIEPYYLGRPKHEVASELPPLTSRRIRVGMSPVQAAKYQEALSGLLEVGTGEEKEVSKLTAVTYCQEIVNHPMLIDVPGDSEKLDELLDILTEGDLAGEKVIVFTRFEKMVGIGIEACEKAGVKCVRITGKEDEDGRKAAQDTFQNGESGVPVVWITTAGSDAINLQAAKAIVFYDTPFSAGDYLQTLGRMIRIGSVHDRVFALHLVTEDSIDERVMDIMDGKMGLLEAVLGKRLKGDDSDDDEVIQADKGSIDALFDSLTSAARGLIRG
jgi:SNF2 family DNA or RNA helicase